MADIVDRNVIVLAPEERYGRELLPISEHVECCGLALPLCDDPMLDANSCARMWIGPAGNVARGKDSWRAGFKIIVNHNATVEREARTLGERNTRAHADASNHEVGIERAAAAQGDPFVIDVRRCFPEVEDHAMVFMQGTHEIAHLRAKDPLHGSPIRGHHMHLDITRTERGRNFEPDEARTEHNSSPRCCRPLDDRATV